MYFSLYGEDEWVAIGGLECVCHLYFFCVAGIVFRVEQGIDSVRAHDVRVGHCVFIVVGVNMAGFFLRSMIVRSASVTLRMSCGL